VEKQIGEINERELQLTQAINRLAEITTHIANKQRDFHNWQFAVNRQLLGQQNCKFKNEDWYKKIGIKRSLNARDTQREIEEYNVRKLILNALKNLKNIPDLRKILFIQAGFKEESW